MGPGADRARHRLLRVAGWLLAMLALAGAAGGLWLRRELTASLAQADGARALPGLSAPVTVERDARGVPTLRAANRIDVARALGFVHAQERFFQMDLQRRLAAGELAELLGPPMLKYDREFRVHRLRAVARRVVARAGGNDRALLEAYAAGVNAGLAALGARPFEYLLLRQAPVPWRAEDSALCLLAMFIMLQEDPGHRESRLGRMRELLPAQLCAFLAPDGTEWDAPLTGAPRSQPPVPGPEVCDLRRLAGPARTPGPRLRTLSRAATAGPWPAAAPGTAGPSWPTTCTWPSRCPTPGTGRRWPGPGLRSPGSPCPASARWRWAATARWPGASPTATGIAATW